MFRFEWLRKGVPVGLILLLLTLAACSNDPPPLEVVEFELVPTETAVPPGVVPAAPPVAGQPPPAVIDTSSTVALIEVLPAAPTVVLLGQSQLTAVVKNAQGEELTGRGVAWSSDNQQVITVDAANGTVTGVAEGSANVTVISEGVTTVVNVTVELAPVTDLEVTPAESTVVVGGESTLTAFPRDALGNDLSSRVVEWESNAPQFAFVIPATGMVIGVSAGEAEITARVEGVEKTVTVLIEDAPVASVSISPLDPSVAVGGQNQLTVVLRDDSPDKRELKGREVTWTIDDDAVASIDANGLVAGLTEGTATVIATSEGVEASTVVTVSLVAVASVTILGDNHSVVERGTLKLTASVKDANGNELTGRSVVWTSSPPGLVDVDGSGLVGGKNASIEGGTVTVTATFGDRNDTAEVRVQHGTVNTIQVSSGSFSLVEGSTAQGGTSKTLTATPKDADGHPVPGTVTWKSNSGQVAAVSSNGMVTGVKAGATQIIASSGGKTRTLSVTINHGPVSQLVVTAPNSSALEEGGATRTLTATVTDALGHELTDSAASPFSLPIIISREPSSRGSLSGGTLTKGAGSTTTKSGGAITWSSSNGAASVSAGVVTPLDARIGNGRVTITATSGGFSREVEFTVAHGDPVSVTVSGSGTIVEDNSVTYTATVKDIKGHTLSGQGVVWISSNTSRALVNNPSVGKVDAVNAGSVNISATVNNKVGTRSVTIKHGPVNEVNLPSQVDVVFEESLTIKATFKDSKKHTIPGVATWTITDAKNFFKATTLDFVLKKGDSATIIGLALGGAKVTATSNGKSDTTVVGIVIAKFK